MHMKPALRFCSTYFMALLISCLYCISYRFEKIVIFFPKIVKSYRKQHFFHVL